MYYLFDMRRETWLVAVGIVEIMEKSFASN